MIEKRPTDDPKAIQRLLDQGVVSEATVEEATLGTHSDHLSMASLTSQAAAVLRTREFFAHAALHSDDNKE